MHGFGEYWKTGAAKPDRYHECNELGACLHGFGEYQETGSRFIFFAAFIG